jgi:hypothetical protein
MYNYFVSIRNKNKTRKEKNISGYLGLVARTKPLIFPLVRIKILQKATNPVCTGMHHPLGIELAPLKL